MTGPEPARVPLDIAMLHFAPLAGGMEHNFALIDRAARQAAGGGARLLLTPELALSGYDFAPVIGTDWIGERIPGWRERFAELARATRIAILATMPERDAATGLLHNAAVLFGEDGLVRAVHRKIAVIPGGSEAWSQAGDRLTVVELQGWRFAIIICADACLGRLAEELAPENPDLVVSCAAWSPGLHGPDGEWEDLSMKLGRPVLVCNRSGRDGWDFSAGESVWVRGGRRVFSWAGEGPTLIFVGDAAGPAPHWSPEMLAGAAANRDAVTSGNQADYGN